MTKPGTFLLARETVNAVRAVKDDTARVSTPACLTKW